MLDEPLAGLDPMAREMFLEFLEGLTGQGVSVVMVSHNVDALAQHAARIIGMKQGKIVMDGSCQEVLGDSRALRTIGLLGSEAAQTAELLRANGVLPGSGLPVTYEALRDEIIGALTGKKEKTDDADADGAVSPRKYIFHRADAKGKLLGLCLVIAAVIVSKGLIGCIAAAAAALTVSYLAGISLREQIKQQKGMCRFLAVIFLMNAFFYSGEHCIWSWWIFG